MGNSTTDETETEPGFKIDLRQYRQGGLVGRYAITEDTPVHGL